MEFGFGSGILTGLRSDTSGTNTPERFGALQDVSVEFAGDIKELFATNQYPISTARGKTKIMGKAKVAEIKGAMYNELFFGQTITAGQLKYAYNEALTTSNTTVAPTYTVSFAGSTPLLDQGVFYGANLTLTDGNQLTAIASNPGSGQYSFNVSTGIYGFSTFDNAKAMLVNYTYKVATGSQIAIGNPLMGTTPTFKCTLFQQFSQPNIGIQQVVLVLNACVSSRLSFPTRIDDYVIQDIDFSAFADPSGNVGTWSNAT